MTVTMAAAWLRGIVKEVVSGDTVVVAAATQGPAVPPEKRLTLSSLVAPRLVRSGAARAFRRSQITRSLGLTV